VGEEIETKIRQLVQDQIATHGELLRNEREKINSALTANCRLMQRLAAHRIFLAVILSYIGGTLTTLLFQELLSLLEPMLH